MNDSNVPDAQANQIHAHGIDAGQILEALSTMELQSELVEAQLRPFDRQDAHLRLKDLTQLRDGLKRIATRVGACASVADGISTASDAEVASEEAAGLKAAGLKQKKETAIPTAVANTPEDEMFPIEGFSDTLTGLPSRGIAEKAIESALNRKSPRYAGVFVLDRICHMSSRYGLHVGNQAIRHCALFLSQKLPPDSLLFRWRGAAYVTLFDTSGAMNEAKQHWNTLPYKR
jgi:Diguanylate cyclase, GGDEF domain